MNKNLAFRFGAVVVGMVVFFALFEITLRIAFARSMDFDIEMWKYASTVKRVAADPGVGHEHAPGAEAFLMGVDVKINSLKLREKDYGFEKPTGVKRVLMLGDSLTFGWGVEFEDTTAKLLEKRLNDSDAQGNDNWQVINAGVGNYNTSQEVSYFFNEGRHYDPDVVVLNYFINDAEPTPSRRGNFLLGWSYSYIYLKGRLDVLGRDSFGGKIWSEYYLGLYGERQPGWKRAVESIEKLAAYCRENKISLLIANYPELHDFANYRFARVGDDLKAIAGRTGAAYIDLLDAVNEQPEPSLWVTPADPHPNGRANGLYAEALSGVIPKIASRGRP